MLNLAYCVMRISGHIEDLVTQVTYTYSVQCLGTFNGHEEARDHLLSWIPWSDGQILLVCSTSALRGLAVHQNVGAIAETGHSFQYLPHPVRVMVAARCMHWQYLHGSSVAVKRSDPPGNLTVADPVVEK